MTSALPTSRLPSRAARWRDVLLPKEHGSWSLALEPLALGLLAAPSIGGAGLSLAALAGFFARRPLKLVARGAAEPRAMVARKAFAGCLAVAAIGLVVATRFGAPGWAWWLLPSAIAGGIFAAFDRRDTGREEPAEIAGAAAFAALPGAIAAAAGWSPAGSFALSFAMLARAVPTVMTVRARIRATKTGERRPGRALIAVTLAVAGAGALAARGLLPGVAAVAIVLLGLRAAVLLLARWPRLRARTLGIQELIIGAAYVALLGLTGGFAV